jgi:hypothetical protein
MKHGLRTEKKNNEGIQCLMLQHLLEYQKVGTS